MKILHLEVDESVPGIVARVRRLGARGVALVVPPRANLLVGTVNLRLLQKSLPGVEIRLIIADERERRVAEALGFDVKAELTIKKTDSVPAKSGSPREKAPKASASSEKKVSLTDVVQAVRQEERGSNPGFVRRMLRSSARPKPSPVPVLRAAPPSRGILWGFIGGAGALLLFIAYLALPSATIHITPAMHPVSYATNVLFVPEADFTPPAGAARDATLVRNRVPTREVQIDVTDTVAFPATGDLPEDERASGEVIIFNKDTKPKYMVASRIQTADGLIFRFEQPVTLPAAENGVPGKVRVRVEADQFDASGRIIGDRGNIPAGTSFIFPAIPFLSPLFYYGQNEKPFTGGKVNHEKKLIQADFDLAREKVQERLIAKAKADLGEQIKTMTGSWALLDLAETHEAKLTDLQLPPRSELGKKMATFSVTASLHFTARAYDQATLLQLLVTGLEQKIHPDTYLASADVADAEMRFLEQDRTGTNVKVDAELEGREVYDWRADTTVGQALRARLYDEILGATLTEARSWLSGRVEIADSDISIWPLWRDRIPGVPSNVAISIRGVE